MNAYYNDNPDIKSVVDGTNPDCNTCIFAFEGLGDPSLKDDDSVPNGRKNTSDIHPIWLYNAMMVVTKGKNIVYVTRRASTLPDKATSSSNTTLKEGIYTYKTGNHPQYKAKPEDSQYIAMVPTDDPRIAWYKDEEGTSFICKESGGTNLHAGHMYFFNSGNNSEGCQIVHFKDYISFGKSVGFLKDNNNLTDLTSLESNLGPSMESAIGIVGNGESYYSQDINAKYILDRTYDTPNQNDTIDVFYPLSNQCNTDKCTIH